MNRFLQFVVTAFAAVLIFAVPHGVFAGDQKSILVTGASTGICRNLAKTLVEHPQTSRPIFTRDLTVASLLAPLTIPPEHPTYGGLSHSPRLAEDAAGWRERQSLQWVRDICTNYR